MKQKLAFLDRSISWIHPSYRDLVIDELARDEVLRIKFLSLMDIEGVKLAISQAGGSKGDRRLPLMQSARSWAVLRTRCTEIIKTSPNHEIVDLLNVLKSATVDLVKQERDEMIGVLSGACEAARLRWNSQRTTLTAQQLRRFFEASVLIDPLPVAPALGPTWRSAESALRSSMREASSGSEALDADVVLEWARLSKLLSENEPRFLRQVGFPMNFVGLVVELANIVDKESNLGSTSDDSDEILFEAERMEQLTAALSILKGLFPDENSRLSAIEYSASRQEDALRMLYHENQNEPDEDYQSDSISSGTQTFDFESIFSDL